MKWLSLLVLVAACSDSTAPSGPNFLARNDAPDAARFVVVSDAGDTVFNQVVGGHTLACETIGDYGAVLATVYLPADTLTVGPFTTTATYIPGYADQLLVVVGPELYHSVVRRSCT